MTNELEILIAQLDSEILENVRSNGSVSEWIKLQNERSAAKSELINIQLTNFNLQSC